MASVFSISLLLLSLLLATVSECYRYMGCYKENSIEHRRMADLQKNFPGTLTPDTCVGFCLANHFRYAGLQVGVECYCSKDRVSYQYLADQASCNKTCDGDKTKMCGGPWRLSVYDIQPNRVNYVQSQYVGCYADNGAKERALREKEVRSNDMTPEYCVGHCFNYGYKYAGVQDISQCFCGNEIKGQKANEDDCSIACAGDSNFLCGGGWRSSIYRVKGSQPEISVSVTSVDNKCVYSVNVSP